MQSLTTTMPAPRTAPDAATRHETGFYLIEVMVTVLVLTFGLLALSALHIESKQTNLVSVQRSFASQMAHDLLERMRSNGSALATYTNNGTRELDGDNITAPTPNCTSDAQCTPAQIAGYDLYEWEQMLAGAMSTIDGENAGVLFDPVACISGPVDGVSGPYTVAIAWRSTKGVGNPEGTGNTTANACGSTALGSERHLYWVESYLAAN